MIRKNLRLALLFVFVLSLPAHSFAWNPSFTLLGNYTTATNYDVVKSGVFNVQNRNFNIGFELSNKFELQNDFFIKTGLRYVPFKTTLTGGNQVSAVFAVPYNIAWQTGYAAFAIPVQFGKDFVSKNGNCGDFYVGLSVGILAPLSAATGVSTGASGNTNTSDTITTKMPDFGPDLPASFLATADFGASFQPFKNTPRFTMGFMCSIQLNKSEPYTFRATASDTHGNVYTYNMQHQQQYTNCALSLTYKFGRLKSRSYMLPQGI